MLYIEVALGITGYFPKEKPAVAKRQFKVIKNLNFSPTKSYSLLFTPITKLLSSEVHANVNTGGVFRSSSRQYRNNLQAHGRQ
jgi:hypothetical protein